MNRRSPLIAGGAFALIAILAVVVLVLPKMGEVGEAQDQLEEAQDQELSLEVQLDALQEAQAQAPETQRQIARIEDQVPPTADLPALFRVLQGAADRSAVDFFSFSPGTPVAGGTGTFSLIPSQITVTGGYFALDEFLFLLETLPRAAKVISITVSPFAGAGEASSTSSSGSLQMLITVEFYTTDSSAGPASIPGPTVGAGAPAAATTTTTSEAGAAS